MEEGVREVGEMRRHINAYSKANFPGAIESSNRFFPNNKCLRNKIYSVMTSSQWVHFTIILMIYDTELEINE